jgi:hypothetical protein
MIEFCFIGNKHEANQSRGSEQSSGRDVSAREDFGEDDVRV